METRVTALYTHGRRSTRPEDEGPTAMVPHEAVEAVEGMGLREDTRYFRLPPDAHERKRQVSLIDEGTIWRLESRFGPISREFIKAQIVLEGDVHLSSLIGSTLRFAGGAELTLALTRKPCYAMDLIAAGMREAMEDGMQGALAKVATTGRIAVGDAVSVIEAATLVAPAS
jgi:hypothetical protein